MTREGFTLVPRDNGVQVSPASRLTPALRRAVRDQRAELHALLGRPPAGARLHFADESLRPCAAKNAFIWTWEGATTWLYAAKVPPPVGAPNGSGGGPGPDEARADGLFGDRP